MKQEVARHIDVVAAVIRKGDTVFLARRAEGEHLAGYWEFPGGKIELGESPEASLERELGEEFGITARTGACLARTVVLEEAPMHNGGRKGSTLTRG